MSANYAAIAYPQTWGDEAALHRLLDDMRQNAPVVWVEPGTYRPFWAISRHDDIMEIERQPERFLNAPRAVLINTEAEEATIAKYGTAQPLRTLIHMDNPDHRVFRSMTQDWFQPRSLNKLQDRIAALARRTVDRMAARGDECDFVSEVAVWYPLHVIMMILGAPEEDEPRLLKLTQELFGPLDPDMKREQAASPADMDTIQEFFAYFAQITEARRASPQDDVATVIANATIDGRPIGHLEAMSYYIIIATAGHDTTSSASAGGLLALIRHPGQLAALKADPSLIPSAVDEMIRWTTPVKHFLRTATEDYTLRGQTIRAGESLMLLYHAANRDETVFEAPLEFRVDRSPNRHLAFGYGPHLCLGQFLAKLEMRALFAELVPRLEHVELAGDPAWVQANFVSGLKRLPIRYTLR